MFLGNASVQASLDQFRERWRALRQEIRGERQRLERLLQLWREYQTGMDDMVDWLMSILSLMRNEEICDDSLDMVEGQLEHLRVSRAFHFQFEETLTILQRSSNSVFFPANRKPPSSSSSVLLRYCSFLVLVSYFLE